MEEQLPYTAKEVDFSQPTPIKQEEPPVASINPRIIEIDKPKITWQVIIYAVIVIILLVVQIAVIVGNRPPKRGQKTNQSVTQPVPQPAK